MPFTRLRLCVSVFALSWLFACPGPAEPSDAGSESDAGQTAMDGGNPSLDAGQGGDGGSEPDAGGVDAGPPPLPAAMAHRFNGRVTASLHAGDAWFIGGEFTRAEVTLARGALSLDLGGAVTGCDFSVGFGGDVYGFAKVGNAIFMVGNFLSYRGQSARYIAKLDATSCQLDTTFSPPADNGFDEVATVIVPSADGASVFVGGQFRQYRGLGTAFLAKLDVQTGLRDADLPSGTFPNGTVDNPVNALAVDGNTLYVGGSFTRWAGINNSANNIARVDATTGAQDTTFSPPGTQQNPYLNGFTNAQVNALAVGGGALYVGGTFTTYRGVANAANILAKLDKVTGDLDTTFSPPGNNGFTNFGSVRALAAGPSALYVGGRFSTYRGVANAAKNLARVGLADGALDTTFSPPANNGFDEEVTSLRLAGNTLYATGSFSSYRGTGLTPGLASLDATSGALDSTFRAAADQVPGISGSNGSRGGASALLVDGTRLWVGGAFTSYGGKAARGLARFRDDTGAFDLTFSPPAVVGFSTPSRSGSVSALAANATHLFVGGDFTDYRGVAGAAKRLARLSQSTGALDTTFSPPANNGFDSDVRALALVGDALYVGGDFREYRGVTNSAHRLAKLNADSGAIDTTFSPPGAMRNGFDSTVNALVVDDGVVFVGGDFGDYLGVNPGSARGLARLNGTTGAMDRTFSPVANNGVSGSVYALALGDDGLFVGGDFDSYRGQTVGRLAKVNRVDGALVSTFGAPGVTNGFDTDVYALATAGGAVFAGGSFTAWRGVPASASFLARLDATTGALDAVFTPSGAPSGSTAAVVQVLTAHRSTLHVGGTISNCDQSGCVENSLRVNQLTRQAE